MTEIVVSETEHIGMPNYSSIQVMASAKLEAIDGQDDVVNTYLEGVVGDFIANRAEIIFLSLQAWAQEQPAAERPPFDTTVYDLNAMVDRTTDATLTFSMIEKIGLPNYSNITIFSSHKKTCPPGQERPNFVQLADLVHTQMGKRRTIVQQRPRVWVQANQ